MRIVNVGGRSIRGLRGLVVAVLVTISYRAAEAQVRGTGLTRTLAAIASTPLGALTPVGPTMAASRDDALLFGVRFQYGSRDLPENRTLTSYAASLNAQLEGGALISATV